MVNNYLTGLNQEPLSALPLFLSPLRASILFLSRAVLDRGWSGSSFLNWVWCDQDSSNLRRAGQTTAFSLLGSNPHKDFSEISVPSKLNLSLEIILSPESRDRCRILTDNSQLETKNGSKCSITKCITEMLQAWTLVIGLLNQTAQRGSFGFGDKHKVAWALRSLTKSGHRHQSCVLFT